MNITPARRVPTFDDLERAGDYAGPYLVQQPDGSEIPYVWFLLPVHRGETAYDHETDGDGVHSVSSPPWEFIECNDGSLRIDGSICAGAPPYYWHGHLDRGNVWREL